MLKLGKGLKKKKKNKKGKKGEELFTAEELEQYKKEHAHKEAQDEAGPSEGSKPVNSEDFQQFKLLTSGVDDFLRKSQGDLDRIKKDSFFQRKPTPSELKAQEEKEKAELKKEEGNWEGFEQEKEAKDTLEVDHQFEDSGSEYEVDDADDIFDTAYVEALESGEVKLALVPDDDELGFDDGPDPFDTSTADQLLRQAEEQEKRKKKEISLGLAVNVLTGRAERDRALVEGIVSEEPKENKSVRTRPRKIQDLCLLGSFDESVSKVAETGVSSASVPDEIPSTLTSKTLLDDDLTLDEELPQDDSLIQILAQQAAQRVPPQLKTPDETEVIQVPVVDQTESELHKLEEEDEFDEFSALAASSVINQKLEEELKEYEFAEDDPFDTSVVESVLQADPDPFGSVEGRLKDAKVEVPLNVYGGSDWAEIEEETADPFDTTFADNCAPGKVELRLIEREILDAPVVKPVPRKVDILLEARILSRNNSEDFNPREGEHPSVGQHVSIHITDPSGETQQQRPSESDDIVALSLSQRDLLGGSTTDLTSLVDQPLPPVVPSPGEELSRYSDPFDTTLADQVAAPSKVELKFLEQELLSDLPDSLNDADFDPRFGEDVNNPKGVSFDIPSPVISDLLSSVKEEVGARPLTPYYAEPASAESDIDFESEDPFDTSHVIHLPGKQELRLIEQELSQVTDVELTVASVEEKLGILPDPVDATSLKRSASDEEFNPRAEENSHLTCEPNSIRRFSDISGLHSAVARPVPFKSSLSREIPDLLGVEEEISDKVLTPAVEEDISSYLDPFDTSIADNIVPGKAELKVLEVELVGTVTSSYSDDDFNPRAGAVPEGKLKTILSTKPLTPSVADPEDIDPFDTSIADNVGPGKAELRLLESELAG